MAGCIKCHKSETDSYSRQTKLVPMPTGEYSFKEIAIDFVRVLLESEDYYTILVVTDWNTKVKYCILAETT